MRVRLDVLAVGVGVAYVLGVVVAMGRVSYDVWGAFVLAPVLLAGSYLLLRRLLVGELASIMPLAVTGLLAKFVGAGVRYWISYNSYLGFTDAADYHLAAARIAARARAGQVGLIEFIPHGLGTRFIEEVAGVVYTVAGSSRLGGAFVFATVAFWGSVFYLLAANIAVRGLRRKWYAVLVFFAPSIVYWPSSLGKEAWMFFALGLGSYGVSLALMRRDRLRRGFVLAAAGFVGAAFVRPHVATMWIAGAGIAFAMAVAVRRRSVAAGARRNARFPATMRASDGLVLFGVLVASVVGFVLVASLTLRFLDPVSGDDASIGITERVTRILDETERRSSEGGSTLPTYSIDSPADWPAAMLSTLLRPYPWEINDLASLLPGIETVLFVVLGVWSAQRIRSVHRQFRHSPYLLMVICATVMFALAFSSIANLGILTRQRSLVLPFGMLLLCIPHEPKRARRRSAAVRAPEPLAVP